jgi:hypothetical protein
MGADSVLLHTYVKIRRVLLSHVFLLKIYASSFMSLGSKHFELQCKAHYATYLIIMLHIKEAEQYQLKTEFMIGIT